MKISRLLENKYFISEDFLNRDALRSGFTKNSTISNKYIKQYYVNGDVRSFHSIWQRLDSFIGDMLTQSDFKQPKNLADFEKIDDVKDENYAFLLSRDRRRLRKAFSSLANSELFPGSATLIINSERGPGSLSRVPVREKK